MTSAKHILAAVVLCLGAAVPALADQSGAAVSDQRYQGAKYSAGHSARYGSDLRGYELTNCPREYREMYRGSLYCRAPEYQVLSYRHPACPKNVWGLYRGNLYCFGRR